jgi:hypothetical protein
VARWLGRRNTRPEVADFYALLFRSLEVVRFEIRRTFAGGDLAATIGEFEPRVLKTGRFSNRRFRFISRPKM